MPLPDPHAKEPTAEISGDVLKLYEEALANSKAWADRANEYRTRLLDELGDAYAGTVDGVKVVAHRPKDQYAISRLRSDYPDLTEHFLSWKTEQVFDLDKFRNAHPEILEQYQVRALNRLT